MDKEGERDRQTERGMTSEGAIEKERTKERKKESCKCQERKKRKRENKHESKKNRILEKNKVSHWSAPYLPWNRKS